MCPPEGHVGSCGLYAEMRDAIVSIPFSIYDRISVLPMVMFVLIAGLMTLLVMFICCPWDIILWVGNRLSPEPKGDASHAHPY